MKLYILNDDVNSFDTVIRIVQLYLNYPYLQSASIANIVHNSGQCEVKDSDDEDLIKEVYRNMVKEGLHLRIEG
jgi:ATP-dependent Clp protease adapter protein ClpS|tara:strand:+ start:418 stop:639 length:222 start_codon:yes stop_codon:yes gene_type:complete